MKKIFFLLVLNLIYSNYSFSEVINFDCLIKRTGLINIAYESRKLYTDKTIKLLVNTDSKTISNISDDKKLEILIGISNSENYIFSEETDIPMTGYGKIKREIYSFETVKNNYSYKGNLTREIIQKKPEYDTDFKLEMNFYNNISDGSDKPPFEVNLICENPNKKIEPKIETSSSKSELTEERKKKLREIIERTGVLQVIEGGNLEGDDKPDAILIKDKNNARLVQSCNQLLANNNSLTARAKGCKKLYQEFCSPEYLKTLPSELRYPCVNRDRKLKQF